MSNKMKHNESVGERSTYIKNLRCTYHYIEYDSHSPYIVQRDVVRDALENFRSSVGRTTTKRFADRRLFEITRKTEVGNLQIVLIVKQQVFAF